MYLIESKHTELRSLCVLHMKKHKKRFSLFCMVDIDNHLSDIQNDGYPGDELEIRVLEEVLDRIIYVYSPDIVSPDMKPIPINLNEEENMLLVDVKPIQITCLSTNYYSSIVDDLEPFPLEDRKSFVLLDCREKMFKEMNSG